MMKIDLEEVKKSGLSLEEFLALLKLELNRVGQDIPYTSVQDSQLIILFNKGILNANGNGYRATKEGQKIIGYILGNRERIEEETAKEEPVVLKFEEFWEEYPSNDQHGNWLRTRTLKSDKTRCKVLYERSIKNGRTHEELIKALRWEVKDRKSKSTTSNRMSFMKNSASWLNQKEFDIILEELGDGNIEDMGGNDQWLTNMV